MARMPSTPTTGATLTQKRAAHDRNGAGHPGGPRHELHGNHHHPRHHLHHRRGHRRGRGVLLPAAGPSLRRGRDGQLPQAGRGGGGEPGRTARSDSRAHREGACGRAADAGGGLTMAKDGLPSRSLYVPGTGAHATPAGSGANGNGARRRAASDTRLRLYRNPLRLLFSASTWLAAGYLAGYVFITGWLLFSVALTATVTAACLAITLAGIPLLVAAAAVLRGCANVERGRLRRMLPEPVRSSYQKPARSGLMAEVRTRWHDRATWRDVAYLIGLWVPLFILDTIVFSIWLTFLAGITLPAWYWAPENTFDN